MFWDVFESLFLKGVRWRELQAFEQVKHLINGFPQNGKSFVSVILAIFQALGCIWFDLPMTPAGQELDLSGYELVFEDEFEDDELDLSKWTHRGQGAAAGGYFADSQVRLEDGNMVIKGEYLEDGKYGSGWYAGMVKTAEDYKHGYFEARCIANPDNQFWSAFWMQSNYSYTPDVSRGGRGGAEIDIFEAMNYGKGKLRENGVHQTIWCSGMEGDPTNGEGLNSLSVGIFYGENIYTQYNTYGLEWNEDEYIFYINGVETRRTSFADGVSEVEEQVILSLCLPAEVTHDKDFTTEFIIDYVRIYQKP